MPIGSVGVLQFYGTEKTVMSDRRAKRNRSFSPKEKVAPQKVNSHSEDNDKISAYERMIQSNIQERMKFLDTIDIAEAKEKVKEIAPKKKARLKTREKTKTKRSPTGAVRRSARLELKNSGKSINYFAETISNVISGEKKEEERQKPDVGPADLVNYYHESDDKSECKNFSRKLSGLSVSTPQSSVYTKTKHEVVNCLKCLSLEENRVLKVCKERIYSVKFHPTTMDIVLLAGDKRGNLGVFRIGRETDTPMGFQFAVHMSPINCMSVSKVNPNVICTTSYDNSMRMVDFQSSIVQEVFSFDDSRFYSSRSYVSWHTQVDSYCFFVGGGGGYIYQVDTRDCTAVQYKAQDNSSVKVVAYHDKKPNNLFMASGSGYVSLWDRRKLNSTSPLDSFRCSRSVNGLEVSGSGDYLLSTSYDDYLRIFKVDSSELKVVKSVSHNNQTGRWLTTFKAIWVPDRDDLFVVGSMKYPRQIEVWDTDGHLVHQFINEDYLMSVSSVNAFHPSKLVLAGANASGRVFVFA